MRLLSKLLAHILLFLLLFLYSYSFKSTYIDDAFIQFQYAKVFSTSGTWGFFPGARTNTATSPLNVLILSFISLFTRSVVDSAVWLTALEFYLLLIFLCLISKHLFAGITFGIFAFAAFITSPLLLSTLGMESWLFVLLFIIALYLILRSKWIAFSVIVALLTLTRPEGVLLLFLVLLLIPESRRLPVILVYILSVTPWYAVSWVYLGSIFPDTLIIKMVQKNWQGKSFSSGLGYFYFSRFPVATFVSFCLLPLGLLSVRFRNEPVGEVATKYAHQRRFILLIGAYVLLHFAAYTLLRVPPYHWYYVPLCTGSVLLGSLGVAAMIERFSKQYNAWNMFLFALLIPVVGFLAVAKNDGYPLTEAPIHTNWATHKQYADIGFWLNKNSDPAAQYIMMGEIGTLAYYSDRRLVNNFSSANGTLVLLEKTRGARKRLTNAVLDFNFYWRRMGKIGPPPAFTLVHQVGKEISAPLEGELMRWNTSSAWCPHGTLVLKRTTFKPTAK